MSIPAVRMPERRTAPVAAPRTDAASRPAIGWEKHIEFDGHTAGGINIPGGLRMPVTRPRPATASQPRPVVPARRAPEPIGWDRNIVFGGSSAGGINIPGGLRAAAAKRG